MVYLIEIQIVNVHTRIVNVHNLKIEKKVTLNSQNNTVQIVQKYSRNKMWRRHYVPIKIHCMSNIFTPVLRTNNKLKLSSLVIALNGMKVNNFQLDLLFCAIFFLLQNRKQTHAQCVKQATFALYSNSYELTPIEWPISSKSQYTTLYRGRNSIQRICLSSTGLDSFARFFLFFCAQIRRICGVCCVVLIVCVYDFI